MLRIKVVGGVAQSVEQRPFKPWVVGSSPTALTTRENRGPIVQRLGHGPFKAATRVRVPLGSPDRTVSRVSECLSNGTWRQGVSSGTQGLRHLLLIEGPIVQRLGHSPLKAKTRVRVPLGSPVKRPALAGLFTSRAGERRKQRVETAPGPPLAARRPLVPKPLSCGLPGVLSAIVPARRDDGGSLGDLSRRSPKDKAGSWVSYLHFSSLAAGFCSDRRFVLRRSKRRSALASPALPARRDRG